MVNPFYIDPNVGRQAGSLAGLGDVLQENRQRNEAEVRRSEGSAALQSALQSGDLNSIQQVSAQYPELSQVAMQQFGIANQVTDKLARQAAAEIMGIEDPAQATQILQGYAGQISSAGGQPNFISRSIERLSSGDPEELSRIKQFAVLGGLVKPGTGKKFEQAKDKSMAGYSFDPSTGDYSIDPAFKTELVAHAEELAGMEKLDAKAVAGVNDKVTALTKDVREISASAKALEGLEESASAAAQLAAVFKFMKALDPRSVVREGEQDQAVKTGGITDQFLGYINQIQGQGRLSSGVLSDLTNTAKTLANSAIDSGEGDLTSYLDVIADNLSAKQLRTLGSRMPSRFDISTAQDQQDSEAIKWAQDNPTDPRSSAILQSQGAR